MRVIPFRDLLYGVAHLLLIEPRKDLAPSHARAWTESINRHAQNAIDAWDFEELTITEERAFRPRWNRGARFRRVNAATGAPDELFYVTTGLYYRVKVTAPADPPLGTLPTNATYFEALPLLSRYLSYDQHGERAIGSVIGVYGSDPRLNPQPERVNFRIGQRGIDVAGGAGTVWVKYKVRAHSYSSEQYNRSTPYAIGDTVYNPADGHNYHALLNSTGVTPPHGLFWCVMPFPELIANYVKLKSAADHEEDLQTSGKLEAHAEEEILRMKDNERVQHGSASFYRLGPRRRGSWPYANNGFTLPDLPAAVTGSTLNDRWVDAGGCFMPIGAETFSFNLPLINGQAYLDVVFAGTSYGDANAWDLISPLQIQNTVDADPLNLQAGIITARTSKSFRVQIIGLPDSGNYRLLGRVSGVFESLTIEEQDSGNDAFNFNLPLVNGQAYMDVAFTGTGYLSADAWDLVSPLQIQNTVDANPLNVKAGLITARTAEGFRVQLLGIPDSGNYRLLAKVRKIVGAEDVFGTTSFRVDNLPLVENQSYLSVPFSTTFSTTIYSHSDLWDVVSPLQIQNLLDPDPLNISAGLITDRTANSLMVELKGIPDSENYRSLGEVAGISA